MKKALIIVTLLMAFFLCSCGTTTDNHSLLEDLIQYQEEINTLIREETEKSCFLEESPVYDEIKRLSDDTSYDPNLMKTREEFLSVYQNQVYPFYSKDISSDFDEYEHLLDQMILQLQDQKGSNSTNSFSLILEDEPVQLVSMNHIPGSKVVLRFSIDRVAFVVHYSLKLGYDDDKFILSELFRRSDNDYFEYFEFIENDQRVHLRYAEDCYWYQTINHSDNTFYDEYYEDGVTTARWYNPATRISTSTILGDQSGQSIYIYNDRGMIIFGYFESDTDETVSVAWQLLEASGWDSAYVSERSDSYFGVYKGEEKIAEAPDLLAIRLSETNATVWLEIHQMDKFQFTDSVLNLSIYDMDFQHPELTIASINEKMETEQNRSAERKFYLGTDYIQDDVSSSLNEKIDDDLK